MSQQDDNRATALIRAVRDCLGPAGRLARAWPDYEPRPGQLAMAEAAARALAGPDVTVVEAGTGTGKTMAYLIPALASGKKTVVSTGTKNLQEQIFYKDIPFIRRLLGSGFRAACLKGRENYLCLYFFKEFLRNPTFAAIRDAAFLGTLTDWAQRTATGDRAELTDLPDDFLTWSDLAATRDRCLGGKCPDFQDCFLQRARRAAAAADLIVVNHHLFMADLAVRAGGHNEVIPEYEAVVFDEAHQLEEVATQHFGLAVSSWRLLEIRRDAEKTLKEKGLIPPGLVQTLTGLGLQAEALSREFFPRATETVLWTQDGPEMDRLKEFGHKVTGLLEKLATGLEQVEKKDESDLKRLVERAREISKDLDFIVDGRDRSFVYWAERRGRGLFLRASPIEVGPFIQESLLGSGWPLVFASATLTAQGSFDFFKQRLGLWPEVEGLAVESPFDYQDQTLLYVPRRFPAPGSPEYQSALVAEIERLLKLSRGRAFVLFTSYRNLNYASQALAGRLPWTMLVQGQAPRTALLEQFRAETSSVLLATHSFWEGVDVPGESLSAVIIDKLPFPRPDQPLVQARSEQLRAEGLDPFTTYHLPEAIITLKQGLGRLIRTRADRGLLAVLDSRLVTKGYGRKFLASLPPSRLVHDLDPVREFFETSVRS